MISSTTRLILALAVTGLVGGVIGVLVRAVDGPWERATVDTRFALRGDQNARPDITIVAVDNRTLRAINEKDAFDRRHYGEVVRRLDRAGAKVIALDITFTGRGRRVPGDDEDGGFVTALADATVPVIVGFTKPDVRGRPEPFLGDLSYADYGVTPADQRLSTDGRGVVRGFRPPLGRSDSFPIAVARAARGGREIPIPTGALIDFPRGHGPFRELPMVSVERGRFDRAAVRGKIVLIGPTASELKDQHRTPRAGGVPGVEIQAAAVATALDGFPLRAVGVATGVGTTLGLGLLTPLLLAGTMLLRRRRDADVPGVSVRPPTLATVATAGVVVTAGWLVAAQAAFTWGGRVVDVVAGLAAIAVSTVLCAVVADRAFTRTLDDLRRRLATADEGELVDAVLQGDPQDRVTAGLLTTISGYTLTGLIDAGGMGRVFLAVDDQLGRPVALKLINREYAVDPVYRTRFLEEGRLAAKVAHPNVVPIFAAGQDHGWLYIAMQLIDGGDLTTRGPLSPVAAARIAHRVALALEALAAQDVVHRDVKPHNILFGTADPEHPYLTDFGVAAATGSPSTGSPGSAEFMSPEQVRGEPVDHRSDVYALGAVVFAMLTGSIPFGGTCEEVKHAHVRAPRPRVTDLDPRLPAQVDALVQRAMAIDPAERFPRASEFTAALLDVVSDGTLDGPGRPAPRGRPTE